jgi:hypothetical protein
MILRNEQACMPKRKHSEAEMLKSLSPDGSHAGTVEVGSEAFDYTDLIGLSIGGYEDR